MGEWYEMPEPAVLQKLQTSRRGLTKDQAAERLRRTGENRLLEAGEKKAWQVFLGQFQDLLVLILIGAAAVSAVSGDAESTIVILAVITMNAVLGTIQQEKARKSLESLKQMTAPEAHVLRDGRVVRIHTSQVVPGDVLVLQAGDLVAADGRILECHQLQADESALTGESEPVTKDMGLLRAQTVSEERLLPADQKNMVFAGSLVTAGRGMAVVTATGMGTEIGRIASLINGAGERKTPLQISMDRFSSRLAAGILMICGVIFGLSLYRGMTFLDALMFAVALAVAAIPEALSSIVTIVQAMGTQQMAREHAIIKDLKAVESLGCVSVICSDKTGTLTQNRMQVQAVWIAGKLLAPEQLNPEQPPQRYFLYGAALNNDCRVENGMLVGDPTETALGCLAETAGLSVAKWKANYPRISELPFDSKRKYMRTCHRIEGEEVTLIKGAPDVLLEQASNILTDPGTESLSGSWRKRILEQNRLWSEQGRRVLALACQFERPEHAGIVWLGMAAISDPPRVESQAAVAAARRAGIRTVMITGDHKTTAAAIAREVGIWQPGDLVVSGAELDRMSTEALQRKLAEISVYARVAPAHKLRIVEAWQKQGRVTAMTGDGVNDAPALKKADVGIAMGKSGTDVSREAADMILTDDNFATIIKAVSNGRNVYRNICHAISFLLSGNMAGIVCVLYTSLRGLPMPFAPVHLLFINLLTDSLPAIAIGMEAQEPGLLEQPPRDPREGILTKRFLTEVMVHGSLIAAGTMAAYYYGKNSGGAGTASTMAFSVLTLARLFHGFNCRSEQSLIRLGLLSNTWMLLAFETGVVLLAAVLFLPGLQVMFAAADLSLQQLCVVGILACLPTILIQIGKLTEF